VDVLAAAVEGKNYLTVVGVVNPERLQLSGCFSLKSCRKINLWSLLQEMARMML
jgi:hypothetical protein